MGSRVPPVKQPGRDMRHFMADDLAERVVRAVEQPWVQPDQTCSGGTTTEGALQAGAELDTNARRKFRYVPDGCPNGQPLSVGRRLGCAHGPNV